MMKRASATALAAALLTTALVAVATPVRAAVTVQWSAVGAEKFARAGDAFYLYGGDSGLSLRLAKTDLTGVEAWSTNLGGSGMAFRGQVRAASDGGAFLTGTTNGLATAGAVGQPAAWDAFLAKVDSSGSITWVRQLGQDGGNWSNDSAEGPDGSIVIAGITEAGLSAPTLSIDNTPFAGGKTDAYVAKFSAAGALEWIKSFGTPGDETFYAVQVDQDGDIYVGGVATSTFQGTAALGGQDGVVMRLSPTGAVKWVQRFGTPENDELLAMDLKATDSVVVAGTWNAQSVLNGSSTGQAKPYAASVTADGLAWLTKWPGSAVGNGYDVDIDPLGGVWVAGTGTGAGGFPVTGSRFGYLTKFSPSGDITLYRQLGGTAGTTLAVDAQSATSVWTLTGTNGTSPITATMREGFVNPTPTVSLSKSASSVRTGDEVTLTATASVMGGDALTYAWDLDGNGTFETAGGSSVTASWSTVGTKNPTVRVTTEGGGTADSSTSVSVVPDPVPTVSVSLPTKTLTGQSVSLDATASITLGSIATYEWDLDGDGQYETLGSSTTSNTWQATGTQTVRVRVTSDRGVTATSTAQITIYLAPPSGTPGVSINNANPYTSSPDVTLKVVWPAFAQSVVVSNDGGFGDSQTFDVAADIPWTLENSVSGLYTKVVYVRFVGPGIDDTRQYSDDVIFDNTAPAADPLVTPDTNQGIAATSYIAQWQLLAPTAVTEVTGWVNKSGPVSIAWNWKDSGGSGIASGTCPATSAANSGGTASVVCADRAGNAAALTINVNVETTTPTIQLSPLPSRSIDRAVTLRWTASDTPSGIYSTQVRWNRAKAGGGAASAWTYPTNLSTVRSSTTTINAAPGYRYCFSARTRDRAGNLSGWTAARCTVVAYDDRSFLTSTGWTKSTATGWLNGTYTRTTAAGRTLTSPVTLRVREIGIVATRCPTCGAVAVYVGGSRVGTLNLASMTTTSRAFVRLPRFTTSRSGTVKIVSLTSSRVVKVDGVWVSAW